MNTSKEKHIRPIPSLFPPKPLQDGLISSSQDGLNKGTIISQNSFPKVISKDTSKRKNIYIETNSNDCFSFTKLSELNDDLFSQYSNSSQNKFPAAKKMKKMSKTEETICVDEIISSFDSQLVLKTEKQPDSGTNVPEKKSDFQLPPFEAIMAEMSEAGPRESAIVKGKTQKIRKKRTRKAVRKSVLEVKGFNFEESDIEHLINAQEIRDIGLYVLCDNCNKSRYLPNCKDPLDLPKLWYCEMNPDTNANKCTDIEYKIDKELEVFMIFNKYNAGSLVWAKIEGHPWWPAMVDDDPISEDYFYMEDEESNVPSMYHVVFFDTKQVTISWVNDENLVPFVENSRNPRYNVNKVKKYRYRIEYAVREAMKAAKMKLLYRLRTYAFIQRYKKDYRRLDKRPKHKSISQAGFVRQFIRK